MKAICRKVLSINDDNDSN